jgi:hypothetical protein
MKRKTTAFITGGLAFVAFCAALAGVVGSAAPEAKAASCARGTKPAVIGGNFKCLRAGQQCSARYQAAYRRYGFHCASSRLRKGTGVAPASAAEPPYTPPPAPTPAAIDGHYKGVTSQNETFEFDIANGGLSFRGLKTGQINEGCTPSFHLYWGYLNWPKYVVPVSVSGDFTIDTDLTGWTVGSWPASEHVTIRGHMSGPVGSGSLEMKTGFSDGRTAYSCGSGLQTWTVTRTS